MYKICTIALHLGFLLHSYNGTLDIYECYTKTGAVSSSVMGPCGQVSRAQVIRIHGKHIKLLFLCSNEYTTRFQVKNRLNSPSKRFVQ